MEQKMKKPVPPELRRAIRFKKRKKIFENIRISIATVIAAFFAILFLMPIVLTITNSFMSSSEISANYGSVFATNDKGGKVYISEKVNLKFIPDIVSFSQYTTVLLKSPEYLLKFWNSVILVGPIVLFQLIVASLASYGFARYSGKLRSLVFFSYVILMLMPYQVTLVPNYLVAEKLNILNTYWAIWLPGIFSPFAVYLLTKFMKRIPVGVMEAAQIDGATSRQILFKIKLPMIMPSVTICTFLTLTNGFKMFDQNLSLTGGDPAKQSQLLALNIYDTFYARSGPQWKGIGQAKAVVFFILVVAIALIQLKATSSKEVQQ